MASNGIDFAEIVTFGNDPEPRISQAGGSWTTARVAFTPRERDRQSGETKDGETTWIGLKAFKQTADRIVATFSKGQRALVKGKLTTERYTDNNGNERESIVLIVDEIGACPRFADVHIKRSQRSAGGFGGLEGATAGVGSSPAENGAQNGFGDPGGFDDGQPF